METREQRSEQILNKLQTLYPGKKVYDLTGNGTHFVCEVEPVDEHPEYDRAVEVIISSERHKHLKTTQVYKILDGVLTLHVNDKTVLLKKGEVYTVQPGIVHSAEGDDQTLVEIYSTPGWTKEDHIKTL